MAPQKAQFRFGKNARIEIAPYGTGTEPVEASAWLHFCLTNNVKVGLEKGTVTIDTFCTQNNIEDIDLLKIDTEGFDLHVLQGAFDLLQRNAGRFIYVECNDLQVAPTYPGTGLLTIDQFVRPFGYRYIATYNDYNNLDTRLFQSSNALFALPPAGR